jgi:hypothetical protein
MGIFDVRVGASSTMSGQGHRARQGGRAVVLLVVLPAGVFALTYWVVLLISAARGAVAVQHVES